MKPKNHRLPSEFIVSFLAMIILGCSTTLCGAAEPNSRDMVLWYRQPAQQWLQAHALGQRHDRGDGLWRRPAGTDRAQRIHFLVRPPARLRRPRRLQIFPADSRPGFRGQVSGGREDGQRPFLRKTQGAGGLPADRRPAAFLRVHQLHRLSPRVGHGNRSRQSELSPGRRGDHARGVCLLARPRSGRAHQRGQAGPRHPSRRNFAGRIWRPASPSTTAWSWTEPGKVRFPARPRAWPA